jgi:hypothetical protein
MGTFDKPLRLTYLDGQEWEVFETFVYSTEVAGNKTVILVPAGFTTDFASIPRLFWRVLPPTGKYGKAAVIHDYIYRTPGVNLTRAQADGIFRDAMADLGVGAFTRTLMFRGVRAFGGRAYKPRS